MVQSHRLNLLRFGLARLFRSQARERTGPVPALHLLLPIPIQERLVLLAKIDGADERAIREALGLNAGDARLATEAIQRGMERYQRAIAEPFTSWPEPYIRDDGGAYWQRRWGAELEQALGQLLWGDVAVALIGEGVPSTVATLSLKQRLLMYCLLVEGCDWQTTQGLLGCSQWFVRRAISDALERVGGL